MIIKYEMYQILKAYFGNHTGQRIRISHASWVFILILHDHNTQKTLKYMTCFMGVMFYYKLHVN